MAGSGSFSPAPRLDSSPTLLKRSFSSSAEGAFVRSSAMVAPLRAGYDCGLGYPGGLRRKPTRRATVGGVRLLLRGEEPPHAAHLHWPIWLLSPITGALPLQHRSSTWRVTCHDTPVGPDCEVDEFGEARDVPATVH